MHGVNSSRRADRGEREVRAVQEATRVLDRPTTTATLRQRLTALTDATGAAADLGVDLDAPTDLYGNGVATHLERRVATLLGTEDAAFFPSGTMAQQAALRCWAQHPGRGGGL
ncbi:threonine aldolase, partial [Kineococcus sp. T13]